MAHTLMGDAHMFATLSMHCMHTVFTNTPLHTHVNWRHKDTDARVMAISAFQQGESKYNMVGSPDIGLTINNNL